ncbi:MAG: hypothetical protein EOS12_27090 [Mesorhizobium sp.]|nr:MAG: hypothetical protein EOS12_27090 [Mesorhizobium sp.]
MTGTKTDRILKNSRHAIHLMDLHEPKEPLHSYVLLRTYRHQCERMQHFIGESNTTRQHLDLAIGDLRQLMALDAFRALLQSEGFATIPEPLAKRIWGNRESTPDARDNQDQALAASPQLVAGICVEAIDLLEDCSVNPKIFALLRRVVPSRQVEIAKLMIALDRVKFNCAKVFIALTPRSKLADPSLPRQQFSGVTSSQLDAMETDLADLSQKFLITSESLGSWGLELVAVRGYLNRMMDSPKIVRYLAHHFPKQLAQFQDVLETAPRS